MPEWVRVLLVSLLGAGLGAICPFIELAPARAVCIAVSAVVGGVTSGIARMPPDAGF